MPSVALITTDIDLVDGDASDIALITDAMAALDIDSTPVVWHRTGAELDRFDLLLVRSPWDYSLRLPEFLRWLSAAEAVRPVLNPAALIRWNLDKRYLLELSSLGVPVVPTDVCTTAAEAVEVAAQLGGDVVVKPTVSAGSRDTALLDAGSAEVATLAGHILAEDKLVMVQPAIESVREVGELACLFFDGEFSHAVRKGPILNHGGGLLGGNYREQIDAVDPPVEVLALGRAALAAIETIGSSRLGMDEPPLYARIDVVAGSSGPLLLEAELFEPSYFLAHATGSADRFAAAVARRLAAVR